MEENVALDTTKQKKFVKSIKGIKKLIKKNENEKPDEVVSPKPKERKRKSNRPDRGLVYLSHIPHGFYEHEMTQYFKQFGVVTNVRVIRSKRTGNSKGFAFVEFKEPAVAEIVAETMNNYLMGKRLIKAANVPPEKQRPRAMRKHWSRLNNPGSDARLKNKKAYNENKDDKGDLKRARKIISNINKTKKKLSDLGINYDFFTPVDVPEALQDSLKENETSETKKTVKDEKKSKKDKKAEIIAEVSNNTVKNEKKSKKDTKPQIVETKNTKESLKKEKGVAKNIKSEKNKKSDVKEVVKSEGKKSDNVKNDNKKNKQTQEPILNKKEQKQKQKKLKDAGVNPPENFIKVQEDSEDTDSSLEFDSDEYDKMLDDDASDIDSGDDSEGDEEVDDDDSEDDGDDSEEDDDAGSDEDVESEADDDDEIMPLPKKSKGKPVPIVAIPKPQKQANKQKAPAPEQTKRKTPQKPPIAAKKPKFEKQTQQPMKKQFKKKK